MSNSTVPEKPVKGRQGFWAFLLNLITQTRSSRLWNRASALAYDLLMAAIPLVLAFIQIGSLFLADPMGAFYRAISLLPDQAQTLIHSTVSVLASGTSAGTIGFGIITAIWLGSNGIDKFIVSVNEILGFQLRGGYIYRRIVAIIYTVFFVISWILILIFFVFYGFITNFLEHMALESRLFDFLEPVLAFFNSVISRFLPFALFILVLILFYKTATHASLRSISWKEAALGGVFVGIGIFLLTVIYTFIMNHISRLSLYFGSLAGILGLFVWIKYTCMILLFGAQIIAAARTPKNKKNRDETRRFERLRS